MRKYQLAGAGALIGAILAFACPEHGHGQSPPFGIWEVEATVDEMDGTRTKVVRNIVVDTRGEEVLGIGAACTDFGGRLRLGIFTQGLFLRAREGRVSYRIRWDDDGTTTMRFDKRNQVLNVDNDAEFASKLKSRNQFSIELIEYDGGKLVFRFPLAGATRALDQLPCV